MAEQPTTRVLPHELPASLREAGLDNWIREPLDDAVDRRRRIIMPPAVSVLGTPARGRQGPLLAEAKHPDTVFMMGDNPELPKLPERPTLRDFYLLRFDPIPRTHLPQSARAARDNGLDPNVTVNFDDFSDIVGRHFRQPTEGLGFDGSPVAHMWRTMIWPNNFL